jgi:nucleotide-binding universal stress UspA family protein
MTAPSVLVGIDFTEGSRRALQAVRFLGAIEGARVRLVHASPKANVRLAGAEKRRYADAVALAETDEARELSRIAEQARRAGLEVDTFTAQGKPAQVLIAQAKRAKAGLIAVGTSGRKGVGAVFLGSTAQGVLRDSPVPVLVTPARHRQGRRKAGPVLAALAFDDTDRAVLAAAASLAKDLGVPVQAFHAVHIPFIGPSFPEDGIAFSPELLAEDEAEAAMRLSGLAERHRMEVEVRTSVGVGDAATNVMVLAQQVGAAAVVVVGRRKPARRLGSVSAALVHGLDRPLVVVPAGFGVRRRA